MKKQNLIDMIINSLYENDCIDIANYSSKAEAFCACADAIEDVLDDYIIIRGDILE